MSLFDPWLLLVAVAALAMGYAAAQVSRPRTRLVALVVLLFLPLAVFTLFLAAADPAPPGFFAWWATGLLMLSLPFSAWVLLALAGYGLGSAGTGRSG